LSENQPLPITFPLRFQSGPVHTPEGLPKAGFSHPPALPVKPSQDGSKRRLSLPRDAGTSQWINVPQLLIVRQTFDPYLALHLRTSPAQPNDAKLSLSAFVLDIHQIAGLQLRIHALQGSAATADGAQTGGLSERSGMNVKPPDSYRKIYNNALLPAAVHAY
jgi:hypothetical protein